MDDLKVYSPAVVEDTPFPLEGEASFVTTQKTANDTYSPQKTPDNPFPQKRVAVELLSAALNTRSRKILGELQFAPSGALQIGDYTEGTSGDIRISPNGIVARDITGNTTFALDGETGSAVFAGTIQAGTFVAGAVIVGDNRLIMDGANGRFIINDGTTDRILIGKQTNGF